MMIALDGNLRDPLRLLIAAAACAVILALDLATAGALGLAQLLPLAVLAGYGAERRWLGGVLLALVAACAFGGLAGLPDGMAQVESRTVLVLVAAALLGIAELLQRREKRWRMLAGADPLTGTLNRRSYLELSEREVSRSRRRNRPLAVLLLDIDHFKRINDTHGHPAGDAAIRALADCCARTLRPSDFVARFGGEEFAVLLPETDVEQATLVANRLRQAVEGLVVAAGTGPIRMTVSIGVALCLPGDSTSDAIGRADEALYRAKRNGRNRVEIAGEETGGAATPMPAPSAASLQTGILIVDDEAEIRELFGDWLRSRGYSVSLADNAADAIRQLKSDPAIRVLCTDVLLPGDMNGFDLGRLAESLRPDIKLLYMSGHSWSDDALDATHTPVLNKPVRLDDLLEKIQGTLVH